MSSERFNESPAFEELGHQVRNIARDVIAAVGQEIPNPGPVDYAGSAFYAGFCSGLRVALVDRSVASALLSEIDRLEPRTHRAAELERLAGEARLLPEAQLDIERLVTAGLRDRLS